MDAALHSQRHGLLYLTNNFSTDMCTFLPTLQEHGSCVMLLILCSLNKEYASTQIVSYVYMFREHIKDTTEWLIIVD